MGQPPFTPPNAPLSLSTWANTSTLPNITAVKMQPCKTLELMYKLGLKHNRLGTFSHMVTVLSLVIHKITALLPSAGDS